MRNPRSQRKLLWLSAVLPAFALTVFIAETKARAGEFQAAICMADGKEYSENYCLDTNCCTFCWYDNQKCLSTGKWSDCGGC